MRVFGCAWKINFPEIIFSWLCVLKALTRKWFEVKIFTSNHFRTHTQRERERERESPVLRPSSNLTTIAAHRSQHCVDRSAALHRANRSIAPRTVSIATKIALLPRTAAHFSLPSSLNLTGFDEFFFLGFVSFVFLYWGMILYICLAAKKMWSTSRKCVFYGIFKNTTKHQKIFFKTFFEMQLNTWKYFPFLKIAFPENIYFPENILHEPNIALA